MYTILVLMAIANVVMYIINAFKEGTRATDFLAISLNTMLLAIIMKYHEELKCLLENFQK